MRNLAALEPMEGEVFLPYAIMWTNRKWSRAQRILHAQLNETCGKCRHHKDRTKALRELVELDQYDPEHTVRLEPCPFGFWHLAPGRSVPEPESVIAWAIKQAAAREQLARSASSMSRLFEQHQRRQEAAAA